MLTTVLIIGSIAADVGLGAMAYRGVRELEKIFGNLNTRLTSLEDRAKIGFKVRE